MVRNSKSTKNSRQGTLTKGKTITKVKSTAHLRRKTKGKSVISRRRLSCLDAGPLIQPADLNSPAKVSLEKAFISPEYKETLEKVEAMFSRPASKKSSEADSK